MHPEEIKAIFKDLNWQQVSPTVFKSNTTTLRFSALKLHINEKRNDYYNRAVPTQTSFTLAGFTPAAQPSSNKAQADQLQ